MSQSRIRGSTASEIASAVEQQVHAGTLSQGARLPTIRELAGTLRVSPVTVAAAYRVLQSRGLIEGNRRRGTRVRAHAPHQTAASALHTEGLIDVATGNPDPDLLPDLSSHLGGVGHTQHLYGDPMEFRPLVAFAAAEFDADGIASDAVTVTSGTLDAVERVLREHVRPGDRVVVEDPTLPALLDLLGSLALNAHPCSVDDEGPEPGAFERALGGNVSAVILSPRAQNPTGAALSEARASALKRILRQRPQILLIEIDAAGPVSGAPAATLADASHPRWAVVRSTAKFLGPDLRVAVMATDALTAARVQRHQGLGIRWVSHLLQALTLALWSDPSTGRRLARAAEVYRHRRVAMIEALAAHGLDAHGQSGMNVWLPVREEAATVTGLAARGWAVAAGERFRLRSAPAIRITTSALEPVDARRLAADVAAIVRPPAPATLA